MKKMLVPIIIVVLIGVGAAAYFLLFAGSDEPKPSSLLYYRPGDFIATNIKDSSRLVKIIPILEYDDNIETDFTKLEYLKLNEHIIRDTILLIVRNKTEPEMRSVDVEIMEVLRVEILEALKSRLPALYFVTGIYFYDFVLQ